MQTIQGSNYLFKNSPLYEYEWDNWCKFSGASHIIASDSQAILCLIKKTRELPDQPLGKLITRKTRDNKKLRGHQASHPRKIPFSNNNFEPLKQSPVETPFYTDDKKQYHLLDPVIEMTTRNQAWFATSHEQLGLWVFCCLKIPTQAHIIPS